MKIILALRRQTQPDFVLAKDGVHPQALGHLIMAIGVLKAWQVPALVDSATLNATTLKSPTKLISQITQNNNALSFTWRTRTPMPMDPTWDAPSLARLRFVKKFNNHQLTITGLPANQIFTLLENTPPTTNPTPITQVTGAQLAAGINLVNVPKLSTNQRALELLAAVQKNQSALHAAWLKHVGHNRPGKSNAPPLKEALAQAAQNEAGLRQLAKPTNLKLTLQPLAQ